MASQDTSSTLFHLRCQRLRQRKHTPVCQNSPGCCALIFSPEPLAWLPRSRAGLYLRAGDWHPPVHSGRGGGEGNPSAPGGEPGPYLKRPCQTHSIRFPQPSALVSTWLWNDSDTRKPSDRGGAPGCTGEPGFLNASLPRNLVIQKKKRERERGRNTACT